YAEISEKRWLTAVGACGVPQSRRVSAMSAARAGAATATSAAAQAHAASMVSIRFIHVLRGTERFRPSPGDILEIRGGAQRRGGRLHGMVIARKDLTKQ